MATAAAKVVDDRGRFVKDGDGPVDHRARDEVSEQHEAFRAGELHVLERFGVGRNPLRVTADHLDAGLVEPRVVS